MKQIRWSPLARLALVLLVLLAGTARLSGADEPRYILFDLAGRPSQASAINADGEVTGWMSVEGRTTAFLYRHRTRQLVDVGSLLAGVSGLSNAGRALNDEGVVVGMGCDTLTSYRYADDRVEAIRELAGHLGCVLAVNNPGEVAGWVRPDHSSADRRAMAIRSGGVLEDLQSLPPLKDYVGTSQATAINHRGDVVGTFQSRTEDLQLAFLHRKGAASVEIIPALGAVTNKTFANGLNGSRQVTGTSYVSGSVAHAFLAEPDAGTSTDLAGSGVLASSTGLGLNDRGDVVGRVDRMMNGGWTPRAMLYTAGRMWDLNDLTPAGSGVTLTNAFAINDAGQIVAEGRFGSAGPTRAFLLDLVGSNLPPSVDAGGPYEVGEEGTIQLRATGADPLGEAVTFAWDLDGNGTFETPGPAATFSSAGVDGPASLQVSVRARDEVGLTTDATATIAVLNVPPTAVLNATPATLLAGDCFTLRFSDATDPSARDERAGFTYAYDCEGDGTFEASSIPEHVCPASSTGPVAAGARIADKDGGASTQQVLVEIATPQQAIDETLVTTVQELVEQGFLDPGRANALLATARAAVAALDRLQPDVAARILGAFVNLVEAGVRSGRIPPDVGTLLVTSTQEVITHVLGGGGGGCTPPPPPPLPACPCFTTAEIDATQCATSTSPVTPLCPAQIYAQFGLPVVEGVGWSCNSGQQSGFYVVYDASPSQSCASLTTRGETNLALTESEVKGCVAAIRSSQLHRSGGCP